MAQTSTVGSRSLTGRRNHGLGWLPWAAFALLALLAVLAFLIIRYVADDGDNAGLDTSNDPAASATTLSPGAQQGAAAGTAQPTLSAGGRDLFQAAAAGGLGGLVGQQVRGTGATVESVVADEAFWVGSPGRRVLVFLTPQARTKAGESPFQVQAGQRITPPGRHHPVWRRPERGHRRAAESGALRRGHQRGPELIDRNQPNRRIR